MKQLEPSFQCQHIEHGEVHCSILSLVRVSNAILRNFNANINSEKAFVILFLREVDHIHMRSFVGDGHSRVTVGLMVYSSRHVFVDQSHIRNTDDGFVFLLNSLVYLHEVTTNNVHHGILLGYCNTVKLNNSITTYGTFGIDVLNSENITLSNVVVERN